MTWSSITWPARFGGPACPPSPDYYPHMFMLSDGDLVYTGAYQIGHNTPASWRNLRKLDTALETWEAFSATRVNETNSACMFQKNKILTAGSPTEGTVEQFAEIIDFTNMAAPAVTSLDALGYPMPSARHEMFLIPLADGKVWAGGGAPGWRPDLFDPYIDPMTANPWKAGGLASCPIRREHHHSAVLLQDGSVWCAGGDHVVADGYTQECQYSYQIYYPPYFYSTTARPVISDAPSTLQYDQPYDVVTPDAAAITKVRLIRLGAATHSFDHAARSMELRFVTLAPPIGNKIRIRAPGSGNEAPPGYYFLFIARGTNGNLPSLGKIVYLGS